MAAYAPRGRDVAVYLRICQGRGRDQVLPIPDGQQVTLGRSVSASYAFDDPLLSRKHCAVECRGELCRIVDLQSRNGTFVNGQRVGAVLLNAGDKIRIGSMVFEVCPATAAPAAAAAAMHYANQPVPTGSAALPPPPAPLPGQLASSGYPTRRAPAPQPQICPQPNCGTTLDRSARELKGRRMCLPCFDRYDVDEDLIDGFKLLERLETSSFGTTYLAQQLLMQRRVVLKTIQTEDDADPKVMRRFMREAKTGGRLAHPSILELYDVNEQQGILYIVSEYVEGETLAELLIQNQGQALPSADVARAMYQIADGLNYAHQQQIVHRDIKPANVIVRRADGRSKLKGFTLAKNLERAGFSVITADGESLGTPYYMSPEQVRSAKNVDFRSDLYSWAATAYHCLAGRLPLEARSYGEFIDKVFKEDPTPLEGPVPRPLSQLLVDCMRRDPKDRPQTMEDVLTTLEPILQAL
jgi:Protein kinase domain/FHA domain